MMWKSFNLGDLVDRFISGGTPSTKNTEYWEGDIPWVTGADFSDGEVQLGRRHISRAGVDSSATNVVPKGSLLVVTRTGVGKMSIASDDIAISQDITGIVPKNCVVPSFLLHAIESRIPLLKAVQRGATIKGVTRDDLSNLSIPLPALSEQRRIVEIIVKADALRKLRSDANTKAERFLPTLYHHLFGDPISNTLNLPVCKLGTLIEDIEFGISVALSGKNDRLPGTLPILRMANISPLGFLDVSDLRFDKVPVRSRSRYVLQKDDLLFNWRNSPKWIGKTAIFDEDGDYSYASFLFRVRTKPDVDHRFLWQFLNLLVASGWFTQKCRQAVSQANFGREELADIDVPYPDPTLQKRFAFAYDKMVSHLRLTKQSRVTIENLYSSILTSAFSGSLTAKWRESHMNELLQEMEIQEKALRLSAS